MTNYVFDTNCIISAHLSRFSIVREAYDKAFNQGIIIYSRETLNELTQVFTRPKFDKYISIEDRLNAISIFENKGYLTEINVVLNACRDPKDNKFLELAISGNAIFIITGDTDLLVLNPYGNIVIISPADFVNKF